MVKKIKCKQRIVGNYKYILHYIQYIILYRYSTQLPCNIETYIAMRMLLYNTFPIHVRVRPEIAEVVADCLCIYTVSCKTY